MQRKPFSQILSARDRLLGAAIGSGMTATAAEEGGADFVIVLSAGYFRLHGVGSAAAQMPYANANQLTWDVARDNVVPRLRHTPVFIGVMAQDPGLDLDAHLDRAKDYGVAGVTNYPTVALYGQANRAMLEEDGIDFSTEVAMLARARDKGLFTIGFCQTAADAVAMARVPVDILCLNLGTTEWRTIEGEAHQAQLDQAMGTVSVMMAAVKAVNPNAVCVVSGGPVVLPQDVALVCQRTGALGYIGGSSIERFPAAPTVTQIVSEFKQATASTGDMKRLGAMIGSGAAMQRMFEVIRSVAASDVPVLIIGESGTGKELAAREIHRLSLLHARQLVSWNCGATTESLAMSELFGHEKGAFTGAARTHTGKFELANGGTLFMDEVTDLPLAVQASLLRVLQQREIVRVGGEKTILVNVRVIAASNKDFVDLIPAGRFRLDLYYRLSTIVLRMPPLRERPEDIPHLVREVAQEFSGKYGRPAPRLPDAVMNVLVRHSWAGNIRELRNAVERMFLLKNGSAVSRAWVEDMLAQDRALGERVAPVSAAHLSLEARRDRLEETLRRNDGNRTATARELGVTRKTIHKWLLSK